VNHVGVIKRNAPGERSSPGALSCVERVTQRGQLSGTVKHRLHTGLRRHACGGNHTASQLSVKWMQVLGFHRISDERQCGVDKFILWCSHVAIVDPSRAIVNNPLGGQGDSCLGILGDSQG
jgi:hypothetical protein